MAVDERLVHEIVQKVIANLQIEDGAAGMHGVFADMNDAIAAAEVAQHKVRTMTLDAREKVISAIRRKINENVEILANMGVNETGMGNVGDKILKHKLTADKTPGTEDITTVAWSGDRGLTLVEMGPFGVIGAITPATNPSETVICNSIGMIAGGNTVVFNPHPNAKKTTIYTINLINEASLEAGGPDNIACTVENPTLETSAIMMKHPKIPLLVATGGPGVVTAVLSSGKRAIGAGAGNPPALVDETADIHKAARDELLYPGERWLSGESRGAGGTDPHRHHREGCPEPQMCGQGCKNLAAYGRRRGGTGHPLYRLRGAQGA